MGAIGTDIFHYLSVLHDFREGDQPDKQILDLWIKKCGRDT